MRQGRRVQNGPDAGGHIPRESIVSAYRAVLDHWMTLYGYARVSVREPEDKNLDLQVERLVRAGCAIDSMQEVSLADWAGASLWDSHWVARRAGWASTAPSGCKGNG